MATDPLLRSAFRLVTIVPNDDTELAPAPIALYIGSSGNVSVIAVRDSDPHTFVAVPAGSILPVIVRRVRATGTTASGIVGLLPE